MRYNVNIQQLRCRHVGLARIIITLIMIGGVCAIPAHTSEIQQPVNYKNDVYCGIYCVRAAAGMFQKPMSVDDFKSTRYVSGAAGSSLGQLNDALSEYGLYGLSTTGLSLQNLKRLQQPAILHVKKDIFESKHPDHFVLYLGERSGKAWIYDPPGMLTLEPYSLLYTRWDKTALLIDDDPGELAVPGIAAGFIEHAPKLLLLFLLCLVLTCCNRWFKNVSTYKIPGLRQAFIVLVISLAFAFFAACTNGGLLEEIQAVELIQSVHFPAEINSHSITEMRHLVNRDDVVILDARYTKDYQIGHIPGAINIPLDVDSSKVIQELLSDYPQDTTIVIYCQSSSCSFSSILARRLVSHCGFSDIGIYAGGWEEWTEEYEQST